MKPIKQIFQTCILLLLLGCFTSCYKNVYYRIDQETKDYCLFDDGSYWMYLDSATMGINIVSVDGQPSYEMDGFEGFHFEYSRTYFSFYSQDTTFNYSAALNASYSHKKDTIVLLERFDHEAMYHNKNIGYNIQGLELLEIKDSCIINSKKFYDVKVFKSSRHDKGYYWAKHVGLIREETYSNDSIIAVRNLIQYKVWPYNIINE